LKIFGKILSVLAILCYILIAGVLFVAAPMVKGYKPVVILTGSMAPAYPVGTVVYYEPVPQGDKAALEKYIEENIKKGDVISFGKSDDKKSMVTHRVEAVLADRNKISTKGDANNSADPSPINYGDVFGKVIRYHLPYAGYVVKYLQNYYAVGAVFVILLAKLVFNRFADREDGSKKAAAGAAQEIPPRGSTANTRANTRMGAARRNTAPRFQQYDTSRCARPALAAAAFPAAVRQRNARCCAAANAARNRWGLAFAGSRTRVKPRGFFHRRAAPALGAGFPAGGGVGPERIDADPAPGNRPNGC